MDATSASVISSSSCFCDQDTESVRVLPIPGEVELLHVLVVRVVGDDIFSIDLQTSIYFLKVAIFLKK